MKRPFKWYGWFTDPFQKMASGGSSGHRFFANTLEKLSNCKTWLLYSFMVNSFLSTLGNSLWLALENSSTYLRRSSNNIFTVWWYFPNILDIYNTDLPFKCSEVIIDFSEAVKSHNYTIIGPLFGTMKVHRNHANDRSLFTLAQNQLFFFFAHNTHITVVIILWNIRWILTRSY